MSKKRTEYVNELLEQVNEDDHSFELYNEDATNIKEIKNFKDLSSGNSIYTEEDSRELKKVYIPELDRKTKSFRLKR